MQKKVEHIVNDKTITINEASAKIEHIENGIKFAAFGKTKVKRSISNKEMKNVDPASKDEELLKKQSERIEKEVENVVNSKGGKMGAVFKMKNKLVGHKKSHQDPTAIRDPTTKDLVVSPEDIKRVTLEYCANNLKGNKPSNHVKEQVEKRTIYQKQRMEVTSGDTFDITIEDFQTVLDRFMSKQTNTYDFLLKAGPKYRYAIFKYCKRIIDSEDIPESFKLTTLFMVWKHKYPLNILKNNRFIHLKEVLPRTVEAMVVDKMKYPLVSSSSIYQVGGLPGHSVDEHIFTIKSIIAKVLQSGEGIIFNMIDIISFF